MGFIFMDAETKYVKIVMACDSRSFDKKMTTAYGSGFVVGCLSPDRERPHVFRFEHGKWTPVKTAASQGYDGSGSNQASMFLNSRYLFFN